jgi:hypothetical protein
VIYSVLGLYALWVATTYLLEGLPRTLLRPEAQALRLAYTLAANVIVGTVGSMAVLGLLTCGRCMAMRAAGFATPRRTVLAVVLGFVIGGAACAGQAAPSLDPIVVLNGFAQAFPVSAAEVLICWSLLSVVSGQSVGSRAGRIAARPIAALAASVLFGVYHIAHSPPFNTLRMIVVLTVVGLVTSAFFFLVREVYGTIVFHNFLATFGVLRAIAAAGELGQYSTLKVPLIGTALVSLGVLVVMHGRLVAGSSSASAAARSGR